MTDDFRNDDKETKPAINQRKHERVGFYNQVRVATSDNNKMDVFAGNVSKGGIFLRSNQSLEQGQKLTLDFETDKGPVQVQEGEVRWNKTFVPGNEQGVLGVGVEFKCMEQESSRNIGDFIDEVLANEDATTHVEPNPGFGEYNSPTLVDADFQQTEAEQPLDPPRTRVGFFSALIVVLLIAGTTLWLNLGADTKGSVEEKSLSGPSEQPRPTPKDETPSVLSKGEGVGQPALADNRKSDSSGQLDHTQPAPASAETQPTLGAVQSQKRTDTVLQSQPATNNAEQNQPGNAVQGDQSKTQTKPALITRPIFVQDEEGWKVDLEVDQTTCFKHFTLSQPPRLVVDFFQTNWKNETKIRSPVPFIKRARLGNKPTAARLVLDFKGKKVPGFQIDRLGNRFTVRFN